MREQRDAAGRQRLPAPFAPPLGRGMNLQIGVADAAALINRLRAAGWLLILETANKRYRAGDVEVGQCQFVVADPDGYLVRPAQDLGRRRSR